MKIILKKALRHKGKLLKELDIPLESLTGTDLIEVEQQLFKSGKVALMPDYSKVYPIRIAAKAAKIPVEVLENLSARDFTIVTNQVQAFLMVSGSETDEESSMSESEGAIPENIPEISSAE